MDHSSAPASRFRRGIDKLCDEWRLEQYCAHPLTLKTNASAVNDAYVIEPASVGFFQISLYSRRNVAGRESVKVQRIFNGESYGFGLFHEGQPLSL